MVVVGILGNILLSSIGPALTKLGSDIFLMTNDYILSVIPMFVLMGYFLSEAGIAEDLYDAIHGVVGNMRGGLAIATLFAAGIFGAVCGSATAAASTFGSIAVPSMKKHNYDFAFAGSVASAGSVLSVIIPPSTGLVLYGVLTEESIGQVLIGGFLPGIMTMILLIIATYLMLITNPNLGPKKSDKQPIVFEKFKYIWPIPLIFLVSIGGIYAGVFTPTEGGAVGAFAAFIFSLITRRLTWKKFWNSVSHSARITAMVFMFIIGGKIFGQFITRTMIPQQLANYIMGLDIAPITVILIFLLIYTIMGCFIDSIGILVIMTPITYPIAISLGYNGVWFGVVTGMFLLTGLLTPPVGVVSLVMASVTKIPTSQIFKYQIPLWIAIILASILAVIFPQIVLFLPNMMY
jgi:tripartite ATP-independent transporter DctM subunit